MSDNIVWVSYAKVKAGFLSRRLCDLTEMAAFTNWSANRVRPFSINGDIEVHQLSLPMGLPELQLSTIYD